MYFFFLPLHLGTYDVVKSGIYTSPVRVHTEYLPNSNAAGVLYGFLYIGESGIDFSRSFYFPLSRNDSLSYELPSPLPAGVYYVHTYVIGKGGLLSSGELTPVTTEVFSGSGGSQSMQVCIGLHVIQHLICDFPTSHFLQRCRKVITRPIWANMHVPTMHVNHWLKGHS